MTPDALDALADRLHGPLHRPGSPGYAAATQPFSATATQRPVAVAQVHDADDTAAVVAAAPALGVRVLPQLTGHAAAGEVGPDVLIVDTSALRELEIDAGRRVARVGAGVRWTEVQRAAWEHGLLGLAGSTGTVGVAGYVFGGGLGWLGRAHGLAAAHLRSVDWVDGRGTVRRDGDDALWAFRGGGGVGVATRVDIDLVPAAGAWGGAIYWPAGSTGAVAARWGEVAPQLDASVTTALAALVVPPHPGLPSELHGQPVVRLIAVGVAGDPQVVRSRFDDLDLPLLDTLGPIDATGLGALHLDPPDPAAAVGDGYWLTAGSFAAAADLLAAPGPPERSGLIQVELRHAGTLPSPVTGALTVPPGPVLLHANGRAGDADIAARSEAGLDLVRAATEPVATGLRANGFCDARLTVPDAFSAETRERLLAVHAAADPDGTVVRPRTLR